ncbi:MAG: hypothetical protein ACOYOL_05165 [Chthoniobacterales bacterium]
MKVTIELPDNISNIINGLSETTLRPVEEIIIQHLATFLHFDRPSDFLREARDLAMDGDETPESFGARAEEVYTRRLGRGFPGALLDTWIDEEKGMIEEDTGILLRQAAQMIQRG